MRKLVYFIAATVDGCIASPDGSFEFFPMGDHLQSQVDTLPETLPAHLRKTLGASPDAKRFSTVVMGRKTYEVGLREGIANPYAPLETIVFSRTLAASEDPVRVTAESPTEVVKELKTRDAQGDIWLCGGGQLAGVLADHVDEIVVKLNPLVVGAGTPLWATPFAPRTLQLREVERFDSGVLWLTYSVQPQVND